MTEKRKPDNQYELRSYRYGDEDLKKIAEAINVNVVEVEARRAAFDHAAIWYRLECAEPRRPR